MKKIKKFLSVLGPGFITGASDDDPSGIAAYSQTGAMFGYTQLWTALFTIPFMSVIQETCGRIGMVTGRGIAGVIREHYSKKLLYFAVTILLIANTVNIGADLGAMASSAQLLVNLPFVVLLLIMTAVTLILEIFVPYVTYAKVLKYLAFTLLTYVVIAFIVKQDWQKIALSTFVPTITFSREYILNIVAILGTTISPYLFFWQADEEVEEEVAKGKIHSMGGGVPHVSARDIKDLRYDTIVGMVISNLVMFFIIVTNASTLGVLGIKNIETANQAAVALKPIAGDLAFVLFAAGIIGMGLLAVPILAGSASYAVAETMKWREGLSLKFKQAHGFYGVITIATIVGLIVNFTSVKPFTMLYYTAILNGIAAPPLLIIIMLIANNKKIMGSYVNGRFSNILGWSITGIMTIAAIFLLATLIS